LHKIRRAAGLCRDELTDSGHLLRSLFWCVYNRNCLERRSAAVGDASKYEPAPDIVHLFVWALSFTVILSQWVVMWWGERITINL